MRQIHTFKYFNRTFRAGDLTIGDYWLYLKSPDEAIEKILLEFNDRIPRMSPEHTQGFSEILFTMDDDDGDDARRKRLLQSIKNKDVEKMREEIKSFERDFHIEIGAFWKLFPQAWESLMAMPYWAYRRITQDIKIITGDEPIVKDRHKKTLDSAGLKKALQK